MPLLVDAITQIVSQVGAEPELWATGAVSQGDVKSYVELRQRLRTVGPPVMLLYGTGWGLAPSVFQQATLRIHPIEGVNAWNHLSVRAACAIILDRLCGLCLP